MKHNHALIIEKNEKRKNEGAYYMSHQFFVPFIRFVSFVYHLIRLQINGYKQLMVAILSVFGICVRNITGC